MARIDISEKSQALLDSIPEFNAGSINYDQQEITNANFGQICETIELSSSSYDFITSFSISLQLPALTSGNHIANPDGYISWINNIGHAIIEGFELKINNEEIININFPFDKRLDIYNELNNKNDGAWPQLGKYETNRDKEMYDNKSLSLEIPLHLWMSEQIKNAFPFFLIDSGKIHIKIKFRKLSALVYNKPGVGASIDTTITPIAHLNIGYYNINDPTLKTNLKKQNYSTYFNALSHIQTNILNSTNVSISPSNYSTNPLRQIVFVFVDSSRDSENNDISSEVLINKNETDKNGNDYFNYGNPNTSIISDTLHSFDNLNLIIDGKDFYKSKIRAPLLQKVYSSENKRGVTGKMIYPISFDPNFYTVDLFGCLDMGNVSNLKLAFNTIQSNSNLYVFFTHIRKMSILNGKIMFDEWGHSTVKARLTGFRVGESHIGKKADTQLSLEEEKELEVQSEVLNISNQFNIYTTFLVGDSVKKDNNIYIDLIAGNNLTSYIIDTISKNKTSGSFKLHSDPNHIFEIVSLNIISNYEKKLLNFKNLHKQLISSVSSILDKNPNPSVKELFNSILPFSKGLYINDTQLNNWIHDITVTKNPQEIILYINDLVLKNVPFNSRIYRVRLNKVIDISKKPFKENLEYEFKLDTREFNIMEYKTIVPAVPMLYIIPTNLIPLITDLEESEIIDLITVNIPIENDIKIKFKEIKSTIISTYKHVKNRIFERAKAFKNDENSKYTEEYERLKVVKRISDGFFDSTANNFDSTANNYFRIYKVTNLNIIIMGAGQSTLENLNSKLETRLLSHLNIKSQSQNVEFSFLD